MRAILQRVKSASVTVENKVTGQIQHGILILLGIEESDNEEDITWLASKIAGIRIFDDENGVMNLSLDQVKGRLLIVSQFTLMASTKKGNRPSYIRAARPEFAKPMYEKFISAMKDITGTAPETGIFGAMMQISLINDGPVTLIIDTKNKE